jgi:broad specificity phosphatase PhoE
MRGILLVRHGNTTYDKKVDALLDPPLDAEGVERIKRTVQFLDEGGYKPGRIVSSPLQRALKVASMISRGNAKITTSNAALPWNLGDLMGKANAQVDSKIKYLETYPDIRAPHGESYRSFVTRWSGFLHRLMDFAEANPEELLLVVSHSRNINALREIIGDAPLGDVKEIAPEASVTHLAQNGVSWNYELIWDGS